MKFKLTVFLGIGIFALVAAFGFVNFCALPQTSAEEFARDFAAGKNGAPATEEGVSGTYNFDKAHSFIGFRVKHMGLIEVPGYFRDFTGTINYDAKDVSKSSVEFTTKISSVDTGAEGRNNHLQKPEFFDAAKFPDLTFKSTKVEKKGNGWMITGDLTIRDVTKQISFPFNIAGFVEQRGGMRMGVTAETTINRRDFGVNYGGNMPNGMAMISDDIKVGLQIEAGMQKKEEAAMDKK
ncbi:MAG: YceI family protein [Pyrinomonadaceae bacterium]